MINNACIAFLATVVAFGGAICPSHGMMHSTSIHAHLAAHSCNSSQMRQHSQCASIDSHQEVISQDICSQELPGQFPEEHCFCSLSKSPVLPVEFPQVNSTEIALYVKPPTLRAAPKKEVGSLNFDFDRHLNTFPQCLSATIFHI